MKALLKITFVVFCINIQFVALAQEPRPEWVRNQPLPPKNANFIYVYGMGVDENEQKAELAAWKNALFKAFNEGGLVGVLQQNQTFDNIYSMKDLETQLPNNVLSRRLICQTPPIYVSENNVKVYLLLQVQRDGGKTNDFYNYNYNNIICESTDFVQTVKEWNKVKTDNKLFISSITSTIWDTEVDIRDKHSLINNDEVRKRMVEVGCYDCLKMFDKGISQTSSFPNWNYWGYYFAIPGIGCLIYYISSPKEKGLLYSGIGLTAVGGTFLTIGYTKKYQSRKNIENALLKYNTSDYTSECKIGITSNGLSFTINF